MKPTFPLFLVGALALASPGLGQPTLDKANPPLPEFDFLSHSRGSADWRARPEVWNILSTNSAVPSVQIGKQEIQVGGSVVKQLRGRKLREVPAGVLGLLVPQPMPAPTSGGKYFAWGDGQMAWTTVASGRGGVGRNFTDPVSHEPDSILFFGGR